MIRGPAPVAAVPSRTFRQWIALVLLLAPALALFVWAGSSWNPRSAVLWTWTKSRWLVPAPGLGFFWLASSFLVGLLSAMSWLLFHGDSRSKKLKPWASAAIILVLAVVVRMVILAKWVPLELGPAAPRIFHPFTMWRSWLVVGDCAAVALLLVALAGAGKSLWWATLYAVHPLVLWEIAGNGHVIGVLALPVVFVAAISHRLPALVRTLIAAVAAVVGILAMVMLHHQHPAGFSSLALDILQSYHGPVFLLPLLAGLLFAVILALAQLQRWPLAKTLAHVGLVTLIFSPVAYPWYILPVLALVPLAWTRAGWVLGITLLAAYAAIPLAHPRAPFELPDWLLFLEWMPVMVLEVHELAGHVPALFRRRASAPEPAPLT